MNKHLIWILWLGCAGLINGQNVTPILERKLTIKITNQPLGKVLNIISETADFNFSYGSHLIKVNKAVTLHAENRTVKEVLDQLFNNELTYQQIGNHLILQKRITPRHSSQLQQGDARQVKYHYIISGYLRDLGSGNGLPNVSVYEKLTLSNTLSGDFGYYQLFVTSKTPEITVSISGQDYRDTSLRVTFANGGAIALSINLQSRFPAPVHELVELNDSDGIITVTDTPVVVRQDTTTTRLVWQDSASGRFSLKKIHVEETRLGKWVINNYRSVSEKNIRDSFERKWQMTLVPSISSNGSLSGLVTNMVSLNLLAGYNGGVNGVEFGGLANFVRRDVLGLQCAGLGNFVGGNVTGAQFSGLLNTNFGNVKGFQSAGLLNHNFGIFTGVQVAGIYNYNNAFSEGVQLAGCLNINRAGHEGLQVAGFGNYAGSSSNLVQLSGALNVANTIDGGQIGVINTARKIRGFQIGLINIADSSEGVAIGLVNFIRNGTHQLEMGINELRQYGLAYRSGTHKFYSILSVTTQLPMLDTNTLMSCGFGIGTSVKISNVMRFTLDLASHQQTFNFRSESLNLMNRLNANLEIKIIKGVNLFGGVSLCHLVADTRDSRYETRFRDFGAKGFWREGGLYEQHAWVGYQFGLRLF